MSQDYTQRPLGALPSPGDPRDFKVARSFVLAPNVPAMYVASPLQPVRDQGMEGTCVGHAMGAVFGHHLAAQQRNRVASVRDAYEGARLVEPVDGEGAYPRAALKNAQKAGLCQEPTWPYKAGWPGTPGATVDAERPCNRVASYAAVTLAVPDIKAAIHTFGPVLIVLQVHDGFYQPVNGFVSATGRAGGYHAVTLVGWDDQKQAFRLQNSWGTGWGEGGFCWLPYSYALTEAWSIIPALSDVAPPPPPPRPWWAVFFPWWA